MKILPHSVWRRIMLYIVVLGCWGAYFQAVITSIFGCVIRAMFVLISMYGTLIATNLGKLIGNFRCEFSAVYVANVSIVFIFVLIPSLSDLVRLELTLYED